MIEGNCPRYQRNTVTLSITRQTAVRKYYIMRTFIWQTLNCEMEVFFIEKK